MTHALPPGYRLVPPAPELAEDLARVHAQCWHETYRGMLTDEVLDAVTPESRVAKWRELAVDPEARERTRVALWQGPTGAEQVVGFVTVGPARHDEVPVDHELWAVYVVAAHHGTGLGAAMVDATLGDRAAYLWVLTANTRAQAFYRKLGFKPDGGEQLYKGTPEIRMARR